MNGYNIQLINNPMNFLNLMTVNSVSWFQTALGNVNEAQVIASTNMIKICTGDLEAQGGTTVRFRLTSAQVPLLTGDTPLTGYWCPFLMGGGLPGFVDIPRHNPQYNFLFTAAMNGCALIITESPVANNIRVYHHQHPGDAQAAPSALATGIWQAINNLGHQILTVFTYEDYFRATVGATVLNAFNFMHYDAGHWWFVSQPQSLGGYQGVQTTMLPGQVFRRRVFE